MAKAIKKLTELTDLSNKKLYLPRQRTSADSQHILAGMVMNFVQAQYEYAALDQKPVYTKYFEGDFSEADYREDITTEARIIRLLFSHIKMGNRVEAETQADFKDALHEPNLDKSETELEDKVKDQLDFNLRDLGVRRRIGMDLINEGIRQREYHRGGSPNLHKLVLEENEYVDREKLVNQRQKAGQREIARPGYDLVLEGVEVLSGQRRGENIADLDFSMNLRTFYKAFKKEAIERFKHLEKRGVIGAKDLRQRYEHILASWKPFGFVKPWGTYKGSLPAHDLANVIYEQFKLSTSAKNYDSIWSDDYDPTTPRGTDFGQFPVLTQEQKLGLYKIAVMGLFGEKKPLEEAKIIDEMTAFLKKDCGIQTPSDYFNTQKFRDCIQESRKLYKA